MTAPTEAPTSTARVIAMLTLPDSAADDVAPVVAAVNSLVRGWLKPTPDGAGGEDWDPAYVYGATLLAARLYRRRDSAEGVMAGFGVEGAMYVQRNDPDVAMLLRMGAYTPPAVG